MEDSLKKFFNSQIVEIQRSQINPAVYNPRKISDEGKKLLKRSLRQYGVLGGIIVNSRTNNTIVGGHQKVAILDEVYKYPDNDYSLRVELIDVDLQTEKTINIALNNSNITGDWDWDKLAAIIPDIDYKEAGLTDADLNMIGVDYLLKTEEESQMADEIAEMMAPVKAQHEEELMLRQAERAEKIKAMKDLKQKVKEEATEKAQEMDAYVMITFDTFAAKAAFCERFDYPPEMKFIKGEVFSEQVERVE